MAYLELYAENGEKLAVSRISEYNISAFSLKNTFTGESGNTVTYPVRMHKKRIDFTAEMTNYEYSQFIEIIKKPEISCAYKSPESENLAEGIFTVTSDISVVKIMSETPENSLFYAVSLTLEEV
ncbi:MAG: hypothetical protein K2J08_10625 [Ruminococcus sp.]|nr:hypothetical protein [Ruminococcus sp.]